MKISDRIIDPQKKEDGAWVENIPTYGDWRFKTRGIGNRQWAKLEQKLINDVPRRRRFTGIEAEDRDRINNILLLETALLDWENLEDDDGNPIPYSKEVAKLYLTDPKYVQIRDAIYTAAFMVAEQREAEIEDDAKN